MPMRTRFILPESIDQAFTELYDEGADDDDCEAFASHWGGFELEQVLRAFEQGQGDDKLLAILTISASAMPDAETLLLPLLEHPETPRQERWASAFCLSRMQQAFPLIEKQFLCDLSLDEYIQAYQEHDDTDRYALRQCNGWGGWRARTLLYMRDWHSPTFISTLRQIIPTWWEIQKELCLSEIDIGCYDELALILGQNGVFDAFNGLDLPPPHRKVAMILLAMGYLRVPHEQGKSVVYLVNGPDSNRLLQEKVQKLLAQHFGLTEEEQEDCVRNFYWYRSAREQYRMRRESSGHENGEAYEIRWEKKEKRENITINWEEEEEEGEEEYALVIPEIGAYKKHTAKIHALSWSPESQRIVSGSADSTAQVWDRATGETLITFREHGASVNTVAWSPQGKLIASGGNDNTVYVWNADTGEKVSSYRGHHSWIMSLAWSPDGTRLASASLDKTVQVWNASSGKALLTLEGHEGMVYRVAWSPDGELLASGGGYPECMIYIWDASTGTQRGSYRGHTADREKKRPYPSYVDVNEVGKYEEELYRKATSVHDLQWSPDGQLLASAGPENLCCVWNVKREEDLFVTSDTCGPVIWSPHEGTLFLVPTNTDILEGWNVVTQMRVIAYQVRAIGHIVQLSPDENYLLTTHGYAGEEKTAFIWQLPAKKK